MSTCISQHGEYGDHEPDGDYTCQRCFALDEEGVKSELRRLRGLLATRTEAAPDVITRLPDQWEDEADEHVRHGFHGLAEGLRTAAAELTAAIRASATRTEARCAQCGGLNGGHGYVHTRHGNGGGSNLACPLAALAALADSLAPQEDDGDGCGTCLACDPPTGRFGRSRFYACATCGNKRCPATTDCRAWECSGSNEPNQERRRKTARGADQ